MTEEAYTLRTIGYVRASEESVRIELMPKYRKALRGLEGFSHVIVIWWCHLFDSEQMRAAVDAGKPYTNGPDDMGIFATRSPVRPNPIAFTPALVTKLDVKAGIIETPFIDAEDDSPVLDLKPYSPCLDRVRDAVVPECLAHQL